VPKILDNWFGTWFGTPWYSMLYGHRGAEDAQPWVVAVERLRGPANGRRLLDLACGRGRHAQAFALAGWRVTGVDLSEESIEDARKSNALIDFRVHDMREPLAGERFDLVVNLFTSFGYFRSKEDDLRTLRAVVAMLAPGGRFLLDFMNTPCVVAGLVPQENVHIGGVDFAIERSLEEGFVRKDIHVHHAQGEEHFTEWVQALYPQDMVALCRSVGLRVLDTFGSAALEPYAPLSDRFVLWTEVAP
jgi:SAM-dependent methyltransferase